jgi:hypothetical protein
VAFVLELSVIELKVRTTSREDAAQCIQAIFGSIKLSQDQILSIYILAVKINLGDDDIHLDRVPA